ncbi:unnamed protein product, partial [Closterium sp. NIES-54]
GSYQHHSHEAMDVVGSDNSDKSDNYLLKPNQPPGSSTKFSPHSLSRSPAGVQKFLQHGANRGYPSMVLTGVIPAWC